LEILLLNPNCKYNAKSIRKAVNKVTEGLKASSFNHPNDRIKIQTAQLAGESLIGDLKGNDRQQGGQFKAHQESCKELLDMAKGIRARLGDKRSVSFARMANHSNNNNKAVQQANQSYLNSTSNNSNYNHNLDYTIGTQRPESKLRSENQSPNEAVVSGNVLNFRHSLERIRTHFYRNQEVKFRCEWEGYDIETTETAKELLNWPEPTRKYLKALKKRSINTIIKRAPELTIIMRK